MGKKMKQWYAPYIESGNVKGSTISVYMKDEVEIALAAKDQQIRELVEGFSVINAANGVADYKRIKEIARTMIAKYQEKQNG